MPRNGSGTMTVVNSFSPGTTISSSQVNANNTDIADELTNSLALDGQSTMSGQLKAADGTDTAPGITFGGDLDTGFYRSGTNTFKAVVSSGTVVATFGTSGLDAPTLKQNGTAVAVLGANTFTADQTITSTDAGQVGPALKFYHNSASPAASDGVGYVTFNGKDGAGNETTYAKVFGEIVDTTDTSEDGRLAVQTVIAGSLASRAYIGAGIYTPNATGGDPGADKINAAGYQINGTAFGFPSVAVYENQQTSGTSGPSYTAGAWRTVTLNTEVVDADGIGSLSSNRVTLGAGTYKAVWSVAFVRGSTNSAVRTRLYNVTDTAAIAQSVNGTGLGSGVGGDENAKTGVAYFTLAGSKALEVQLYCTANSSTAAAVSTGQAEVYAQLLIEKVL